MSLVNIFNTNKLHKTLQLHYIYNVITSEGNLFFKNETFIYLTLHLHYNGNANYANKADRRISTRD